MAVVNRKNIEKIFMSIDENFSTYSYGQKLEFLYHLERENSFYNGERLSESELLMMAIEKIEYDFARIYCEGKAKSTITRLNKLIKEIKMEAEDQSNYLEKGKCDEIIKDLITYVQISMNLDITFYKSLLNLYKMCLENEKEEKPLAQTTIKYNRGGNM